MSVASIGTGMVPLRDFSNEGSAVQKTQTEQLAAYMPEKNPENSETQKYSIATADLEKVSLIFNKRLQFVVDNHSNQVTVKVIDRETDKVIKELPPEELQRLHGKLKETIGFLFDQQV